jgi:hypothetical protein
VSYITTSQKKILLTHLNWNLQRLDEVLKQGQTDYFKSAALQRFGHAYIMAIKSIHGFGEPKDETEVIKEEECIKMATEKDWNLDPLKWHEMITDYQRINQKPNEKQTEAVYQKLPDYLKTLENLYINLKSLL